jgi:drug/metabolite transporter (DMT)-like permease
MRHGSNASTLPVLAVCATILLWGLSFVSSKTILNTGVPPMTMVCLRFLVSTALINLLLRRVEPATRLSKRDMPALLASGLLGVTVYFFFESRGIKLTSASHASLIIAAIPVCTVIAEFILSRVRVGLLGAGGVVLSFIGVYFVVRAPGAALASGSFAGDLFMFGACLSWVAYMLVSKNLHRRLSDLAITAYQSLFGTLLLIPFALLEFRQWVPVTPLAGLNLLYLAVFSSAVGNYLYMFGLSRLGPVAVSPYINLIPVVGVLGGVVLLGESIAPLQIAGGVVIVAGVFMVGAGKRGAVETPAGGA